MNEINLAREFIPTVNDTVINWCVALYDTTSAHTFIDSASVQITVGQISVEDETTEVNRWALQPGFPNPFNATTTIAYSLETTQPVTLNIFNTNGQLLKTLVEARMNAGEHSVAWDGKDSHNNDVGSGVYFYQLKVGDRVETKRLVLIR